MKALSLTALCLIAMIPGRAAEPPTIQSLIGRKFAIHDDWAGQELTFRRRGNSIRAVWRILGSGVPVVSEVESPVKINSERQCEFQVRLRDENRSKVKVELWNRSDVRIYLNGVRVDCEERRTN
jgi:hypothetical protein